MSEWLYRRKMPCSNVLKLLRKRIEKTFSRRKINGEEASTRPQPG